MCQVLGNVLFVYQLLGYSLCNHQLKSNFNYTYTYSYTGTHTYFTYTFNNCWSILIFIFKRKEKCNR